MTNWTLEPFEADDGTVPFERFVGDLPEAKAVALENALAWVLSVHGLDLARTEWLKALGDGLHEFRVRHDAETIVRMFSSTAPRTARRPERVLLRLFVHFHGNRVILPSAATTRAETRVSGVSSARSRLPESC